jgi:predicted phage terminase large subunit-like protein
VQTAELDSQRGPVQTIVEQAPGLAKEATDTVIRILAGYNARADRVSADKVTRAEPFAAQAEAGNVALLAGVWNTTFLDELTAFPYVDHDDQTDTGSGALNILARGLPAATHANPIYSAQSDPVYVPGKGFIS